MFERIKNISPEDTRVDIPIHQSVDTLTTLRTYFARLLILPVATAAVFGYLADKVDTPLSTDGYEATGDDPVDISTHEIQLEGDYWYGAPLEDSLISQDKVDIRVVPITDDTDPEEIAEVIIEQSKLIHNEFNQPILIDADIVHPSSLDIDPLTNTFLQDAGLTDTAASPILSYSLTSTLGSENLDNQFIEQIRQEVANGSGLSEEITFFPKSGLSIDLPYTFGQFKNVMGIAQDNGLDSFDELLAAAEKDTEQGRIVDAAIDNEIRYSNDLDRPAIVFTTLLGSGKGGSTITTQPCSLPVESINATYEFVEPARYPDPSKLLIAELPIWAALSFRRKKIPRWIGTTAVPKPDTLQSVKDGTASTFDKLHTLKYLQQLEANPEEKKTGFILHRANPKILAFVAFSSMISVGLLGLSNESKAKDKYDNTTEQQEDVKTFLIGGSCTDDMTVVLSADRAPKDKQVITNDKTTPNQLASINSGK